MGKNAATFFRSLTLCALVALTSHATAGSVSGTVIADEAPVPNARVTLFVPTLEQFFEQRTDARGGYAFGNVPLGEYRLGVAAVSYEYQEVEASVKDTHLIVDFDLEPENQIGSWDIIGDTLPELFDATDIGILLPDGTIFYCHNTVDPIRFDPVSGEKTFPAGSPVEQGCMNGTLLEDGRIIMAGGQSPSDPGNFTDAVPWVKTYSTDQDDWALLADMQHRLGRWYPGLARLADGSLLVMGGGQFPDAQRTETCERFDLVSETWEYTGSMQNPAEFPPSALLHSGEVLATWWPPQLYNPDSGQWRPTGNFVQPQRGWPGHSDHSLVVLADGRALAIGYRPENGNNGWMGEIYDPSTEQWSVTSNPDLRRFQTEVVQLPDGRVLVAGGEANDPNPPVEDVLGIVTWCDLYDPTEDSWRRVADLNWFREYHAVTLLVPDGRVLTTGGTWIKFQFGPTSADIEAYSPPYLLRGVRPQITSISTTDAVRGAELTLEIFPDTQITSVVLMGAETTTHWVAGGVPRRLVLPVEQNGSIVDVSLPSDPNVLPLGFYMLFAMVDDIPSVAEIVKVAAPPDADLDEDGVVGTTDLLLLLGAWGLCDDCADCLADLDQDCVVGATDLLILLGSWGRS